MKKKLGIIVLLASIFLGIYLSFIWGYRLKYSEGIRDENSIEKIKETRDEKDINVAALVFNDETLTYDKKSKTFYYSLIDGDESAFNPDVKIKGNLNNVKLVFSKEITSEEIENNEDIEMVVYTDTSYCVYTLKCTTLPIMNIQCQSTINGSDAGMTMTLYDNREDVTNRVTKTQGTIRIRGNSTREYTKKSYKISTTYESPGNNMRANNVSLLGLRGDDDWQLYAAYNDQEKIRNVFSSNLWKYSCATDNANGVNMGMEYKYLELFINGQYYGLYALGYPIDAQQVDQDSNEDYSVLYKKIDWYSEKALEITDNGSVLGYEVKSEGSADSTDSQTSENSQWRLLFKYYDNLLKNVKNSETLYNGIDLDNAIDYFLFINLIQGEDNAKSTFIKNMYLYISEGQQGINGLLGPWDLDLTWGNSWYKKLSQNYVRSYYYDTKQNFILENGYLTQILNNGDTDIIDQIVEKYYSLRNGAWSDENIENLLDGYESDIYESGAYLREMERWPQGTYSDPEDKLTTFKAYVKSRFEEMDLYIQRIADTKNESIYIRKTSNFKNFYDSKFIIEINNKKILKQRGYVDLFTSLGMDIDKVSENIRYVLINANTGEIEYLEKLCDVGESIDTCIGTLSVEADVVYGEGNIESDLGYTSNIVNTDEYTVLVDGIEYYSSNSQDETKTRMIFEYNNYVNKFVFSKYYTMTDEMADLVSSFN